MENESSASDGVATNVVADSQVNETPVSNESSPMASIDRAFDKVFSGENDGPAPVEQSAAEKPEVNRTPDGKFAPKDQAAPEAVAEAAPEAEKPAEAATPDDAPSRFSHDAKAVWKDVPPAVKGEVNRAFSELEKGLNHYKAYGEQFRGVEQYAQMAANSGKSLDSVLQAYVGAEQMLRRDPVKGIEHILSNVGITPQQYAAHIMGMQPDQQAHESQQTIIDLRNQISQLQQQFGNVSQTIEQQQQAEALRQIESFKAGKPRFEDLRNDMKFFMETGKAQTLEDAYMMADRLNPAPVNVAPQTAVAAAPIAASSPNPAAQTRKAALSVVGAPTSGSNPANRKPASTREEAINRAFARVGL